MRAHVVWGPALLLLAACGGSPDSNDTAGAPAPVAAPEPPGAREIDSAETDAMLEILRADQPEDKRIWLVVSPANPDTVELAKTLELIFREGGWQPTTQQLTGMMLKPGPIRILVGDETEPPSLDPVRRALEAGGLTTETGTGYRAFYDERKRENPNWAGIPMDAEQTFIVVIAPPPKA
ncbi:MAG TPA: hypothetical protein VNO26_16050 [Candidatus Limnocylindria bacterium]|nr:hypothetical protein [Candidatus Limnocylindria bacterium]